MYVEDDDYDPREDEFKELDDLVERTIERANNGGDIKAYVRWSLMSIALDEVLGDEEDEDYEESYAINSGERRIYQQTGGSWVVELKYKGIILIHTMDRATFKKNFEKCEHNE